MPGLPEVAKDATHPEETLLMETTLTMAGQLAHAGAARPAAASGLTLGEYGTHSQASAWTQGAIAKPATFMVLDRKNRPTRRLPELTP
jgi:hypothetical protein